MGLWTRLAFILVLLQLPVFITQSENTGSIKMGHMKPFGEQGVNLILEERSDFPDSHDFMVNYLQKSKPVKFAGVLKDSRPVREWTDQYLSTLDIPEHTRVHVETKKKEDRKQETTDMHFLEFLSIYNDTEYYIVDDVPPYLRPDVPVPCSLQCPELLANGFAFVMMWFSSGGTKSVIHTDSFENINCLIRGRKTFIMVDPSRDRDKIHFNPKGAYADIDVDSVDLTAYPAVSEIEFYKIHMEPGDCLYIPSKWIHQVRSFDSNIAVNFWWDRFKTLEFLANDGACQGHCDPSVTLDQVQIHQKDGVLDTISALKDWLFDVAKNSPMNEEEFVLSFAEYDDFEDIPPDVKEIFEGMFSEVDVNKDGVFSEQDIPLITDQTWEDVHNGFQLFEEMMEEQERREYAEHVERDRKQEL